MKDARLEIRINAELKKKLIKLAEDESKRKTNDYLNLLIDYAVNKKLKL